MIRYIIFFITPVHQGVAALVCFRFNRCGGARRSAGETRSVRGSTSPQSALPASAKSRSLSTSRYPPALLATVSRLPLPVSCSTMRKVSATEQRAFRSSFWLGAVPYWTVRAQGQPANPADSDTIVAGESGRLAACAGHRRPSAVFSTGVYRWIALSCLETCCCRVAKLAKLLDLRSPQVAGGGSASAWWLFVPWSFSSLVRWQIFGWLPGAPLSSGPASPASAFCWPGSAAAEP